ncbi:hypothetical protein ACQPYK_25370 [Streptosporangium sp. CA-135522]|uniref:hypothetical protein n=1 Tax=Streptosporangium sp. CA-135522 TaxID=3240072 RepID=UPI003D8C78AC
MSEIPPTSEFTRQVIDDSAEQPDGGGRAWILTGPLGGVHVSFMKMPDMPSYVRDDEFFPGGWMGKDVGYHSPKPLYDGHRPRPERCPFVPGGQCFQSGSSVPAQPLLQEWWKARQDDEVIWRAAEWFYRAKFVDGLPGDPDFAEKANWMTARTGFPIDVDRFDTLVHPKMPAVGEDE